MHTKHLKIMQREEKKTLILHSSSLLSSVCKQVTSQEKVLEKNVFT